MQLSSAVRSALRILWGLGLLLVIVGSLVPASSTPMQLLDRLHVSDKILHLMGYTVLALLPAIHERRLTLAGITVALIALGLGLELAQYLESAGRLFEVGDIAANTGGVLGGTALGLVLRQPSM